MATKRHRKSRKYSNFLCFLRLFVAKYSFRMRFLTPTFVLMLALPCAAQLIDGFAGRIYTNPSGQRMPYRLFIPPGYDKSKPYPLVLWLHGAGGAGTNNRAQISQDQIPGTHTWTKPQNQAKFPTFVLVPQSPTNWISDGVESLSPEMLLVLEILDAVRVEFKIDPSNFEILTLNFELVQTAAMAVAAEGPSAWASRAADGLSRRRRWGPAPPRPRSRPPPPGRAGARPPGAPPGRSSAAR